MILGSLRTLGLTTFLITIPLGIAAALLATRNPFESNDTFAGWVAAGIISQLVMGLTMFAGYVIARRLPGKSQAVTVVILAFAAGAARGAAVALLAERWDLIGTASIPVRILSSSAIFALWLLAIGAALEANDRYRRELSGLLRELLTSELITRSQTLALPDQRDDALPTRVRSQAMAIRDALETTAAMGVPSANARVLRREIKERLRPLSHELWHETGAAPTMSAPRAPFLARAITTRPPLVLVVALFTGIFVLNAIVWHGLYPGLLIGAVLAGAFLTVIAIGYRSQAVLTTRRVLAIAAGVLIIPAAAVWLLAIIGGFPPPNVSLAATAIGSLLALVALICARTAIQDRAQELEDLRNRIDAQVLDQHIEVERYRQRASRTAGFLHNTVQARLTAAALQLDHAARTGDTTRTTIALKQADDALAMAIQHPLGDIPESAQQRLDEIVDAWAGIANIEVTQPASIANGTALDLAVDAIEEAVANAVRHGGAATINIVIEESPTDMVVTVRDDGSPTTHSSGMGEEWMHSITAGQWTRSTTPGGSELTLKLPLSTLPPA